MPYGIKANVKSPHRFLRMGALCWVVYPNPGGGYDKMGVIALSRGGRTVTTWVDARDLGNYRAAWTADTRVYALESREDIAEHARVLQDRYGATPVRPYAAAFGRVPAAA